MIFFSSDPYFDFTIYAMQVWFSYLSLPKLHISFLEVGKKEGKVIYAVVRIQKYYI
jgi:hypothetical protein